ncbi:glycosyltransferase family 4 protein [Pleurocapsales cyanobacterium LEGE 10410]|nr:glycosyltransferase family 4 protein [Pleurocapsales cyanobacterium LEGE 10410]
MKVCIVSSSDGRAGGHAAAYRLHRGLQSKVSSTMLVGDKSRGDYTVVSPQGKLAEAWLNLAPNLDAVPKLFYPRRDRTTYSVQWLPDRVAAQIANIAPDIINLHWINSGYLKVESIAKLNKPIVWTLHDMWAFTGGCHYSQNCDRYTHSCGRCPILKSDRDWDLSRWLWQRKAKAWQNLDLTIVTPSRWLAECAAASSLLRDATIEVIPNGLDTQRYKPWGQKLAREIIGLPSDKQIVLFGAVSATSNARKGYSLLLPALQKLKGDRTRQMELVIFGASQPEDAPDFGIATRYLGKFNDDISIALLYSAADVFVAPSIQDNLPNTVLEALACGTPCVAFNVGGMPDMIDHQQNGYLATAYDPEDLAYGILWLIEDSERWQRLSALASTKVEQEFTVKKQAQRYQKLFKNILSRNAGLFN